MMELRSRYFSRVNESRENLEKILALIQVSSLNIPDKIAAGIALAHL